MTRCANCQTTISGYPDGHWEDLQEGLLLCKTCVEQVARVLLERGYGHLVGEKLRKKLKVYSVSDS